MTTNSGRLKEIISVLTKYGIADWLSGSKSEWIQQQLKSSKHESILMLRKEERVRMALTELGTTFIKFGQILSTRPDLIGESAAKELSKLQSSTPSATIDKIEKRIKDEFGINDVTEFFVDFSVEPIASASIAQVHKAKLKSGENVVVKVMHEGIEEKVNADLEIMTHLASIAQKYHGLKPYQPVAYTRLFKQTMLDELDFNKEFQNLKKFTHNFEDDYRVEFPIGYDAFSGKTVLTMSLLEGSPLNEVKGLNWSDEQQNAFTEESADVFMEMMFRDKFYHADPHPGNLLVRADGTLGVLDCGMIGRVDKRTNAIFEELIIGVAQKDTEYIKDLIINMCAIPNDAKYNVLSAQIEEFLDRYIDISLSELDMSSAIQECMSIIQEHKMILPANVSSVFRVVVLLEGTSKILNPNFNIAVLFKNYQVKIFKQRYSPKAIFSRSFSNFQQWQRAIDKVPKALDKLLQNASSDNFEINLEHRNLEKSVNRVVKGVITASLFLGSSLLCAFKVPPVFDGYSIFGIAGIIISTYLTFQLFRDMDKS
ncbi:AarF/UbiB family protein [Tamlana sp. 2_MG-2023]|uniref:ABC1 kinase family protein n=1 Tax=unclassified Tamlana TaxID=2614803 RepID=UPI0026E2251D|nr:MULTISPECIES: AarF/UbiB family protein [unclassified Tamlana]MDO6761404.1 AarF/UbiB family protein [Tamlana sp. 2_MG-2023]MDO6791982.1 AarF/UbiB family protein [Tamlana sp. 1_MG-2023]